MRIEAAGDGARLWIKVIPNASRTEIVGPLGDLLKVKVMQPPESGKANAAVESLIAETLNLSAGKVRVVSGQTRPQKVVEISGMTADELQQRFNALSR